LRKQLDIPSAVIKRVGGSFCRTGDDKISVDQVADLHVHLLCAGGIGLNDQLKGCYLIFAAKNMDAIVLPGRVGGIAGQRVIDILAF